MSEDLIDNNIDPDAKELANDFGLDIDTAENVLEIMNNEGVSEEEAIELEEGDYY